MYQIIIVIHVLLGLGIIGLILIQQGKGADAGASFGTGSSGSVFGAQGAGSFLSRTTATLASLFFITSLGLAVLNGRQGPAYDLMSSEAAKNGSVAIPETDVNKTVENLLTQPQQKPEAVATPPAPVVEPKATETVEAKPVVEENKEAETAEVKSLPDASTPIAKEEIKPAIEAVKPAALAPKEEAAKPAAPSKTIKPKKEAAKAEKKKAAPKKKDSEKK